MDLDEQLGLAMVRARYALPIGWNGNKTPCLPQHDPHPNRRAFVLSIIRSFYGYLPQDYRENPLTPIAVAGKFPLYEWYGPSWTLPFLPQFLLAYIDTGINKLLYGSKQNIDKLAAYKHLFSRALDIPAPPEVNDWQRDGIFARNYIDGPNPLLLARVQDRTQLDSAIVISDAQFQQVMGPTRTLADELRDGNLFLADYRLLQKSLLPPTAHNRDSRWREKYLPAPVVLFCQRRGMDPDCDLVPVAITIDQRDAVPPNPLYLRNGNTEWLIAKSFVQTADFNLQAISSHLYRQHFVAEPFALTTRRQLSPAHPVYVLLEPHIAYTLQVNKFASDGLKQPGSIFDQIHAGELAETRQIMIESYLQWSFQDLALERDLVKRNVDSAPTEYPYREDARLWMPVITDFVNEYLTLYYSNDSDVLNDWELQSWAQELMSPDGGAVRGLLPAGRLTTVTELASLLAQFLFTAGPSHASLHYPQIDFFSYVPAFPGAAFQPPPSDPTQATLQRWIDTLPPFAVGADQFRNNRRVNYRYDRFGDYSRYPLGSVAAAQPTIEKLQQGLKQIEETIEQRNQARARAYPYLLPSLVPNSINI